MSDTRRTGCSRGATHAAPGGRAGRPAALAACAVLLAGMLASCRHEVPPPVVAAAPLGPPAAPAPASAGERFTATAYSIAGKTADGSRAREGVVAADPDLLPLGTRIRVHGAGQYSGEYVVRDTGPKVQGREIDIYIANDREAKEFGRKPVRVEVLERGVGVTRK